MFLKETNYLIGLTPIGVTLSSSSKEKKAGKQALGASCVRNKIVNTIPKHEQTSKDVSKNESFWVGWKIVPNRCVTR